MKVLVPIDGSEGSTRAARYVLDYAKNSTSVEITLLSVVCFTTALLSGANTLINVQKMVDDGKKEYATALENAKRLFSTEGINVKTELLTGDPGNIIIHYVESNGMDKVVMGSRGLSSFKGMILGSVSHKVLSNIKVPVTIVK